MFLYFEPSRQLKPIFTIRQIKYLNVTIVKTVILYLLVFNLVLSYNNLPCCQRFAVSLPPLGLTALGCGICTLPKHDGEQETLFLLSRQNLIFLLHGGTCDLRVTNESLFSSSSPSVSICPLSSSKYSGPLLSLLLPCDFHPLLPLLVFSGGMYLHLL